MDSAALVRQGFATERRIGQGTLNTQGIQTTRSE